MIELPSDYPQLSASVDGETGKFLCSHSRQRASRLRQEAKAKRVQCLCDQTEASRAVKAYSFNLNDSSFVGQFLSLFFAFFITP